MRRDDALLTVAGLSVSAFLLMAGPSPATATADPGGSNGNGGNSSSAKGPGKGGAAHGNTGNGNSGNGNSGNGNSGNGNFSNGGSGAHGNSGGNAPGQTNTGKPSKSNGNSKGNGGGSNAVASGAQSNSGSDSPAAAQVVDAPDPPVSVVVAEQHTGTTRGAHMWWPAADVALPALEVPAPPAPGTDGVADLLSADHTGIPVWAAAEPIGLRGDLFGLAGLVLMPLVGLAVGYRQAKAARDAGLTVRP